MTELKCPVCNTVLDRAFLTDKVCGCPKCRNIGNVGLWEVLADTKKKLDIAVDALKLIDDTRSVAKENLYASYGKSLNSGIVFCWTTPDEIHNTLKQVNQKEEK